MSAIDTYKKCSLHSAAPYIGRNVQVCKKGEGKRPGRGVRGECPTVRATLSELISTRIPGTKPVP